MKRSMCVFAIAAAFVLAGAANAADFTLQFNAPATTIYGQPGATKTFDVTATMLTSPDAPLGSSGWSLSFGIDAGTLPASEGTDDCSAGGGDPATPKPRATFSKVSLTGAQATVDWTRYERVLANPGPEEVQDCTIVTDAEGNKVVRDVLLNTTISIGAATGCGDTQVGAYQKFFGSCYYGPTPVMGGTPDPCGTKHIGTGAYQAIILRQDEPIATTKGTVANLMRVTVSARIPEQGCVDLNLFFKDGYKTKDSQPQTNVVTVGTDTSLSVELRPLTIQLCAAPAEFGVAVVPEGGTPPPSGDTMLDLGTKPAGVVTIPVDVILSSSGVPAGVEGPPAWSLSIANEACSLLDSVTLEGITVNALAGAKDPLPFQLKNSTLNTATAVAGGAVSLINMGKDGTGPTAPTIYLHSNVSDKVLKLIYKITVGEGEEKTCNVTVTDGLDLAGLINNEVSWGVTKQPPAKRQGLSIHVIGATGPKEGADFLSGDPNMDGTRNIADAVRIIMAVVPGLGSPLLCMNSGDVDANGSLELGDAISIIDWQFDDGVPPVPPEVCGKRPGVLDTTCPAFTACP